MDIPTINFWMPHRKRARLVFSPLSHLLPRFWHNLKETLPDCIDDICQFEFVTLSLQDHVGQLQIYSRWMHPIMRLSYLRKRLRETYWQIPTWCRGKHFVWCSPPPRFYPHLASQLLQLRRGTLLFPPPCFLLAAASIKIFPSRVSHFDALLIFVQYVLRTYTSKQGVPSARVPGFVFGCSSVCSILLRQIWEFSRLAGHLGNTVELPKFKSIQPRCTSRWDTL